MLTLELNGSYVTAQVARVDNVLHSGDTGDLTSGKLQAVEVWQGIEVLARVVEIFAQLSEIL